MARGARAIRGRERMRVRTRAVDMATPPLTAPRLLFSRHAGTRPDAG